MPEYLAPGVYVEERDTGAKAIEGVSTTTTGFVGVTERGVVGVPTLVIGTADYQRRFGDLLDRRVYIKDTWYLPHAVEGFFTNGGKRLYIVRVASAGAKPATATLFDRGKAGGTDARLAAPTRTGDKSIVITDDTGIVAGDWLKVSEEDITEHVKVASLKNGARALRGAFRLDHALGGTVTEVTPVITDPGVKLAGSTPAGATSLTLNAAGLAVVNDNVIEVAEGSFREFLVVDVMPSATVVKVKQGLMHDFTGAATVKKVDSFGAGVASKLSAQVKAGDAIFTVEDETGFTNGLIVEFKGGTTEYQQIHDIRAVQLRGGLVRPHATGATVSVVAVTATPADLANATALGPGPLAVTVALALTPTGGDWLVVGDPASPNAEVVETSGYAAGVAALKPPGLANPHVNTDPVRKTRSITQAAKAGDTKIVVHDAGGNPQFLEIGLGTTREIAAVDTTDVATKTVTLKDPLLFDHAAGSSATLITVPDSNPTTLSTAMIAGSDLLLADDVGAYAVDSAVLINGTEPEYRIVGATFTVDALGLTDPIEQIHGPGISVLSRNPLINVEAIDVGAWGNAVRVTVEDDDPILITTTTAIGNVTDPLLPLTSAVGIETGSVLEVDGKFIKATGVGPNRALFSGGLPFLIAKGAVVKTREFRVTVEILKKNLATGKYRVVQSEVHRRLSMDPDHTRFFARVIGRIYVDDITTPLRADGRTEGESDLIRVSDVASEAVARATIRLGPDITIDILPDGRQVPVPTPLRGGDDDIANVNDKTYIGADSVNPKARTGHYALQNIEEISLVAIPGRTGQELQQALLTHCELMRYRFAVIDPEWDDELADVQVHRSRYDSKYGALYHPWPRINDPFPDNPAVGGEIPIPPSGHILGIYARSDIEYGVHKAPANEVVRGIVGLQEILAKAEQDVLNPKGINVIRDFTASLRGRRVWGARTISSDPDSKYINVRRTFIFIEHSIDNGTQWVVFMPNSELLWSRVARVIRAFLTQVWRDGALMGLKPEEAFYVKCDRTTMTQNDIDNGRLIVEIGVAVVKPAEFVIFRIGQWTATAEQG